MGMVLAAADNGAMSSLITRKRWATSATATASNAPITSPHRALAPVALAVATMPVLLIFHWSQIRDGCGSTKGLMWRHTTKRSHAMRNRAPQMIGGAMAATRALSVIIGPRCRELTHPVRRHVVPHAPR